MIHLGDVPASTTIYIPFTTYAGATGASVTCSGLAVTDIEIYKNGSTTQRSSYAGYTLLDTDGIDFDGITGLHGFSIDLSNNTDSGFFAVGSWYWVVVSAITVDSQTVTFLAATFRIGPAEALTGHPKVDVGGWLGTAPATPTTNGVPEVDVTYIGGAAATSTTVPTAAAIADAVWDEDATAHQTQGTFGQAIGDPAADTNSIFKATVTDATGATIGVDVVALKAETVNILADTAEIGAAGAGLTALATQTSVNTIDDFLDTEVAAIKAKTDNLPSDPADQSAVEAAITAATSPLATAENLATVAGYLDTEITAIKAKTDNLPTDPADQSAVEAAISSLNNLSAAQVNAEVLDVLSTDTFAELGAIPAATSSLKDKLTWMFMWFRNKIEQTSTTKVLKADNGTTTVATFTESYDGTTYTSGEGV